MAINSIYLGLKNYAKNILTVPRMNARQIGQFRKDGAQLLQHDKCPQGKNTTLTSSSMQILQILASFNCWFSSIRLLASEKAVITRSYVTNHHQCSFVI